MIVDTDAIPRMVSRLRVDTYSADGSRWMDSREVERIDELDWPATFTFYEDKDQPGTVLVRLRAFPQGVMREYHGERYTPRSPSIPPAELPPDVPIPANEAPRLYDAMGNDITPRLEPTPEATIDRLLRIEVQPGYRGKVVVILRGACLGTMARLRDLQTCTETENEREPVVLVKASPGFLVPDRIQRTFGARIECDLPTRMATQGLFDDEVCVPGGGFMLGNLDGLGEGTGSTLPLRPALLPPFRMDKFEVTVGRWRSATGFVSPDDSPQANDATLGLGLPSACTFSTKPMGREDYPLNCVSVPAAEAFCEYFGGTLPSEAEWLWVAQDAERPRKTRYPWGDDPPSCDRAVYARDPGNQGMFYNACVGSGRGPQREDAAKDGDVAIGTNIVNLAGSMAEFLEDGYRAYTTRCWASLGLDSPKCVDPTADASTLGAAWPDNVISTLARNRRFFTRDPSTGANDLGFRCVRRGP